MWVKFENCGIYRLPIKYNPGQNYRKIMTQSLKSKAYW